MSRTDKQLSYEERYKAKMEKYKEAYKIRTDFASKFKLKPEKTKGYYNTGDPAANIKSNGGSGSGSSDGAAAAGTVPGNNNEEKIWNFFAQKGFTIAAVSGVMGNLMQESTLTTTAIGPPTKYGNAYGLGQWLGGRLNNLKSQAVQKGVDVSDLGLQLEFLWWELNGGDATTKSKLDKLYGGMEALKSSSDYKWVVRAYEDSFERSGGSALTKRENYALGFLNKYGKGNGSGAATVLGGSGTSGNTSSQGSTSAQSLSIKFQVSRDIKAKAVDSIDTAASIDSTNPYDYSSPMITQIGSITKGKYRPPNVNRIGYVVTRLEDARLSKWKGWAPLDSESFIHLSGPQENLYAKEARQAFSLLKRNLDVDKIKIIHGFEPKLEQDIRSMHNVGMAIDVYVENIYEAIYLADIAWTTGFRAIAIGGSELDEKSPGFVHIDCGPKAFWALNHHDVYKGPNTFKMIER